ncbi:MAG: hypothetical protein JXA04_01315 [Gammaproteobacteria bacterium]|nr:hypothetical protein [Gammaproteobacteria bacterium]
MFFWDIGLGFGIPAAPEAPTITCEISDDDEVTVSITGAAGATHYLKYKGTSDTEWQDGGSRSGDGDIIVSGLSVNIPYIFIVYSQIGSGPYSIPGLAVLTTLTTSSTSIGDYDSELIAAFDKVLAKIGKPVVYKPGGGGSRQIRAIIVRFPPAKVGPSGSQGRTPKAIIAVKNDSTEGISSTELDTGGDKISYPVRIGQDPQDCLIGKKVTSNIARIKLEVN